MDTAQSRAPDEPRQPRPAVEFCRYVVKIAWRRAAREKESLQLLQMVSTGFSEALGTDRSERRSWRRFVQSTPKNLREQPIIGSALRLKTESHASSKESWKRSVRHIASGFRDKTYINALLSNHRPHMKIPLLGLAPVASLMTGCVSPASPIKAGGPPSSAAATSFTQSGQEFFLPLL